MARSQVRRVDYVDDVIGGKIKVPRYVMNAVKRHVNDLKASRAKGSTYPYRFDAEKGWRVVDFVERLYFTSGLRAGEPFILESWQKFILLMIFGWVKKENGFRRFQQAYIGVPRKNGKTTFSSGTGLYMIVADGELSAKAYTVASKKDQARLSFDDMKNIIKITPGLSEHVSSRHSTILCDHTMSTIECLASDSNTLDGLNASFLLFDEFHTQDDNRLYSVLRSSFGARKQPLMIAITTAGFNTQSFAFEHENYVKSILDGRSENDSIFGIIWCPDIEDDPHAESTWQKVNPNWGVSLDPEQFRFQYKEAKSHPQKWNEFLTKKLNIWTTANAAFLAAEKVDRVFHMVDEDSFAGRRACLALDLSISHDLTGYTLTFEKQTPNEKPTTIFRAWIPEETLAERVKKESINFGKWVEEGWVKTCPGETISYQQVLDQIMEDADKFDIVECAYDPFNATLLVKELEDRGFNIIKFPQSIKEFSPPTKYLEKLILEGEAIFQDSPVAFWCFTNAEVQTSDYGIKPKKPKNPRQRIDLLICAIMSLWRTVSKESSSGSVYEERGIRFL